MKFQDFLVNSCVLVNIGAPNQIGDNYEVAKANVY